MGISIANSDMKIAIIHDWFISVGGAEKVLKQLLDVYPNADVFCLLDHFNDDQRAQILSGKQTRSSYLQRMPFSRKHYRVMVPFFYKAIEKLNLSDYDVIISSSHAIAKGVVTTEGQTHFCYCHTPVRYVWNMKKTYLGQIPKTVRGMAMLQLNRMKRWDLKTSEKVDYFIANSRFVADRIAKNYRQESVVINPPVDAEFYQLPAKSSKVPSEHPYYLVVSRLVHYKKVDLIVETFNQLPNQRLVIVGTGPQKEMLKEMANDNIVFLDFQTSENVRRYMQYAEAMILAAIEDFGITSLEAQACGTPVIAYNYGGYKETVKHMETGVLFEEQTVESIKDGIERFNNHKSSFDQQKIRENAQSFGNDRFRSEIKTFIEGKLLEIAGE